MRKINGRRATAEDLLLRLVQDHAAELLRYARRFSLCADDAHDAYQRALEILVRRMRTNPPEEPLKWLMSVVRNEALTVRAERHRLVGREELDAGRHGDDQADDPAERVAGHERIGQVAEALQRLKPQEVTALVLRAEGLSYKEICAQMSWSYTKTNRCVTEGRRALLRRLGAIESGAECDRWLSQLSALADGEATAREVAELRPHLRGCSACRATLRELHDAPRQVAALVPVALVPAAGDHGMLVIRQVEAFAHAVLERATFAATRLQGAFEAAPGAKLAAVAASTAAIAGGGAALEQRTHAHERPRPAVQASAPVTVGDVAPRFIVAPSGLPNTQPQRASVRRRRAGRDGESGEFTLERSSAPAARQAAAPAAAQASAFAPHTAAAKSPPAGDDPPAEFAGP
jgi:RNA polymerase sigma factor (sigma-70 family)